jgi:ATP-dependent helicase/nuclease subunit B
VYHGLSLQLLAYLDALVKQAPVWLGHKLAVGGAFYFHVNDKMEKEAQPLDEHKAAQYKAKKHRMQGLVRNDPAVIVMMDEALSEPSVRSTAVPLGTNKLGQPDQYSPPYLLDATDWDRLLANVQAKMVEIGNAILGGELSIAPSRLQKQSPCSFCKFQSVCQVDHTLGGPQFRYLSKWSRDEVLAKL